MDAHAIRLLYQRLVDARAISLQLEIKVFFERYVNVWGKITDFFIIKQIKKHFFRALPLPACFTTKQSTVEASLFVKYVMLMGLRLAVRAAGAPLSKNESNCLFSENKMVSTLIWRHVSLLYVVQSSILWLTI